VRDRWRRARSLGRAAARSSARADQQRQADAGDPEKYRRAQPRGGLDVSEGHLDHAFLAVPAQDYVGQFLMTFRDYPQRQKAASFNMDEVMKKLQESSGAK